MRESRLDFCNTTMDNRVENTHTNVIIIWCGFFRSHWSTDAEMVPKGYTCPSKVDFFSPAYSRFKQSSTCINAVSLTQIQNGSWNWIYDDNETE